MPARELIDKATATLRREGVAATARKAARYGLKPLRADGAVARLQRESAALPPGELYDYVQAFDHHGIDVNAFQLRSEIARLLDISPRTHPLRSSRSARRVAAPSSCSRALPVTTR